MSRLIARNLADSLKRFSYSAVHYDIDLNLNPRRKAIRANVAITLVLNQSTRSLSFFLGEQFGLEGINYLGISLPCKVSAVGHGLNLLAAVLPRRPDLGERIVVNLAYSWEEPAWDGALDLPPGAYWYPFSPLPDKYTCSLDVIADESIRVLGPGQFEGTRPAGTRVCSQWRATSPFRGIQVVAGNFLKTARETQPPMEVAYPRKFLNQGKALANYSEEILRFYGELLGPPPFPSLILVLTEEAEPADHSSFFISSLSAGALAEKKEENPGKEGYVHQYQLLAENLAQHWLKDNQAVPRPQEAWYLAGLAKYCSWLAVEAKHGRARREVFLTGARDQVLAGPKIPLCQGADGAWAPQPPWVAAKAGWLFQVCHGLAGQGFLPALRENLALHRDSAPTAAEFILGLGQLAGWDFSPLYKAWCQTRHQLKIEIADCQNQQDQEGNWQLSFSLVNRGRIPWPHPVGLEITLSEGPRRRALLPLQKEPHVLSVESPAQTITVDPDHNLLNWAETEVYQV